MSTNYHDALTDPHALTTAAQEIPHDQLDQAITDVVADVATNTAAIAAIVPNFNVVMPGGRLSLSSTLPVTTADVTAATSIYYHPYVHEYIATYNGSAWVLSTITAGGISIAVPATTDTAYDVFVYDNSGTATLELNAWSSLTARADALVYQDGVLCKTGALTRRYVGSFRTTSVSGQTELSISNQYLWNYYHRRLKQLQVFETTDTWNNTTASWRSANNDNVNRVNIFIGVSEDIVRADVNAVAFTANYKAVGVGVDSTTVNSAISVAVFAGASIALNHTAVYQGYPGIGHHYLQWIEWQANTTSAQWNGDGGLAAGNSGLTAQVWC